MIRMFRIDGARFPGASGPALVHRRGTGRRHSRAAEDAGIHVHPDRRCKTAGRFLRRAINSREGKWGQKAFSKGSGTPKPFRILFDVRTVWQKQHLYKSVHDWYRGPMCATADQRFDDGC